MKISTNPKDLSWYRDDARLHQIHLNGHPVPPHLLIMADSDSGLLVTYKCNDNAEIVVDEKGDTITVIQRGKVTISAPVQPPAEVPFFA